MYGGDLYKANPKQTKAKEARLGKSGTTIPKQGKKRKEQTKTYTQVKSELREGLIAQGKYNCFFCTKPMGDEKGFHHLKGRDGNNFIDKRYLVPGHNQCHVFDYHSSSVKQLRRFEWYEGFLNRLKLIDESLYQEEFKKAEKTMNLFGDDKNLTYI
jgi:hypothetical protein